MTLHRAVLEIDADVDGDGTEENGEFHMVGNAQVSEVVQPTYAIDNGGSKINAVVQRVLDNPTRRALYIDLGEGSHIFELSFNGWKGAVDSDGNVVPWGDQSEPSPSVSNATGEDPLTQIQVFNRYLQSTTFDSLNPATLRIGEYDSSGLSGFPDKVDVAIQAPRMIHAAEDYSTYDGQINLIEVERLDSVLDAKERLGF